jgi:hypothetical protein
MSETASDTTSAAETVKAMPPYRSLTCAPPKTTGRKTMTVVAVDETTAFLIATAPS